MKMKTVVIHEAAARQIDEVLDRFLRESLASHVLLIDRSGQPLAERGPEARDAVSIAALAAGAFSSTGNTAVLHSDPDFPVRVGERCSIGHRAVIHGCTVGDDALIGMGAVVLITLAANSLLPGRPASGPRAARPAQIAAPAIASRITTRSIMPWPPGGNAPDGDR